LQPLDEGAEVALTTINSNADSMSKILFVLMDDDIYDAWVKKAEQLQFILLDDGGAVATNTSKQPTSDTRKPTERPSSKHELDIPKQPSQMKVIDASTSASTEKPIESDHEKSPENLSPNPEGKSDSQESVENEKDDGLRDEDGEMKKKKRYVTSTVESMVSVIFFSKEL
jgi:hypothetical protein